MSYLLKSIKTSERRNLHNRPQAKRSRRSETHHKQHSERVNLTLVQSFRLAFYADAATGCASLTRGYENIVFQTNIISKNQSNPLNLLNLRSKTQSKINNHKS